MARLSRVLFIGGPRRYGSVNIRCVQIANALGCRYLCLGRDEPPPPDSVLSRFDVVVLVKSKLPPAAFAGKCVVWDIIDHVPEEPAVFVASTSAALAAAGIGSGVVVPHHHLNAGQPNSARVTAPAWLGAEEWYPDLNGAPHRRLFVGRKGPERVRALYREVGIGLNLRRRLPHYDRHVGLNSGIKLINCMGFGIPSVSEPEPAYVELGDGCTVFTTLQTWADDVARIRSDRALRRQLRDRALRRAADFRLERVSGLYRRFLEGL